MDSRPYIQRVLAIFESLGDPRLQADLDASRTAVDRNNPQYAADALINQLYNRHRKLVLEDTLAMLPEAGFEEPRRLIAQQAYRAAANEILRLIQTGLWRPGEDEWRIMRGFWDYYAG